MPVFRYPDLNSDITLASLLEAKDLTWLIYPTERSNNAALQAWQSRWQPVQVEFLSMNEFKQRVIYSDQVRLMDEKRLVCLYQSLQPEDRQHFHIDKYDDLIEWGQHFLAFFEEMADEGLDADDLLLRLENNELDYQDWQKDNYTKLLKIRSQYQDFISGKGYTDAIFDTDITHLHIPQGVKRFVFLNQYYYARLEKAIISALDAAGREVIIYYQGKKEWVNEQQLSCSELLLEDIFPEGKLPFRLKISESSNPWQMALSFLQEHFTMEAEQDSNPAQINAPDHFIIDAQFTKQPYRQVFSREQFDFPEVYYLHETRLLRFLQIMATGLSSACQNGLQKLVKLDWLMQAVGIEGFTEYFRPDWDSRQKDIFIGDLCRLTEQDIQYIDGKLDILKLDICSRFDKLTKDLLKDILALLDHLYGVRNTADLTDLIDSGTTIPGCPGGNGQGIRITHLLTEQERTCSNLAESFYEALANFVSLDELSLVDDWHTLYPEQTLAAALFNLLLQFLKPRKFRFFKTTEGNKPNITNLMDTRNLQAGKLTFLNLVEGELPSQRASTWLFNEHQRKAIGLKTWDDVRRWERYYFYRLLAGAKEVTLHTLASPDKDISPSSFLHELYLYADKTDPLHPVEWTKSALLPSALLLNWIPAKDTSPLAMQTEASEGAGSGFFHLPCEPEQDFSRSKEIRMSWSACSNFLKSPFIYFIRDLNRLKERVVRIDETMSRKMFGTLLHSYLSEIVLRLAEQHEGILSMKWEWINTAFLEANLKHTLSAPLLTFQIPRNYNREYLIELLSPFLVSTAGYFFHIALAQDEDLKGQVITLIPEKQDMTDKERQHKLLIGAEDNPHGVTILIRGKADLRLETSAHNLIIDFKTGDFDKLQLLLYAWFYYLIDYPEKEEQVRTGIYKLLDKDMLWQVFDKKWQPVKLKDAILTRLDEIITTGYAPPTDAKVQRYFVDITRADMLNKVALSGEEEE